MMRPSSFLPVLHRATSNLTAALSRPVVRARNDRAPQWLVTEYMNFKPRYSFSNGILTAELYKIERWRETGEIAGFYRQYVRGPGFSAVERYVWIYRYGDMMQVRQLGVTGASRRDFVGRA